MPPVFVQPSKEQTGWLLRLIVAVRNGMALIGAVMPLAATAQPAVNAWPQGGQVVAGLAQISKTTAVTRIDQSSQRAAIDWRSFDVGSGQLVEFNQPSSNAMTLNRVISADPSQIAGKIKANGGVVLVNQSGVIFDKGAQVEAQSVIVSAAGITNHRPSELSRNNNCGITTGVRSPEQLCTTKIHALHCVNDAQSSGPVSAQPPINL